MSQSVVERETTSVRGNGMSHIARDADERPLVGLCGRVSQRSDMAPRILDDGEQVACIVCHDLWMSEAQTGRSS